MKQDFGEHGIYQFLHKRYFCIVCIVYWLQFFSIFLPGLDKIEFLQTHDNQDIYQKAYDIIDRYFGADEEVEGIAPRVEEGSQQFEFASPENAVDANFQF